MLQMAPPTSDPEPHPKPRNHPDRKTCPGFRVWGMEFGRNALLRRNVKRFRGGLVFKARRLLYHSTLGLRVIEKKREEEQPLQERLPERRVGVRVQGAFGNCHVWPGEGALPKLLHRNVQRFRGGLVFKAHRLCVSLNSRLESNKEEGWAP